MIFKEELAQCSSLQILWTLVASIRGSIACAASGQCEVAEEALEVDQDATAATCCYDLTSGVVPA